MELGQSRTRNLNFSQCLSLLPYTTPAEGNLSEEEKKKKEKDMEKGREQEGQWKKKEREQITASE